MSCNIVNLTLCSELLQNDTVESIRDAKVKHK